MEIQTRIWVVNQVPTHCKDYVKETEQPQRVE
jgi:hypothetical protein